MVRRKRSNMTEAEAIEAFKKFCTLVERQGETSDASMFRRGGALNMEQGHINVQFMVSGDFGVAEELFEAVRIFGGHKLPAKDS